MTQGSGTWGAETDQLQTTGRNVHGLGPDADSAVSAVLNSYTAASQSVVHSKVSGALATYRDTHQKGHLQLPQAVRGLGSGTAKGGATLADGENEATSVAKAPAGNAELIASANSRTPTAS